VAGSQEQGSAPAVCTRCFEVLGYLHNWQPLKTGQLNGVSVFLDFTNSCCSPYTVLMMGHAVTQMVEASEDSGFEFT
jgi:hypothetical protein